MQAKLNLKKMLAAKPLTVKRHGEKLFVKTPVYRAKHQYKAVYINADLFSRLFKTKNKLSYQEMADVIEGCFNTTIEKKNGIGKPVGMAYVDKQEDPLGLSLSGNLGSGRAYYMGELFNIKGEKTPLATSRKRRYSDGLLEMERCIWETLVANGLQGSLQNGLGPVLAILDMDETCDVIWRDEPVRRGKIIRVDMNGALDRVTHDFYLKKPQSAAMLGKTASAFGVQEGDKFIERIIHGTWSPGNISPKGHLIDFDTVCAVKGRSPQYSSTQWHHENYFGYEYGGQGKILQALAAEKRINKDKITAQALTDKMMHARDRQIRQRFAGLMGFADSAAVYKRHKKEIDDICPLWIELARKSYCKESALQCKKHESLLLHVFDFSAFFRLYPMKKRMGLFDPHALLEMICGSGLKKPFGHKPAPVKDPIEKKYKDAVNAVIGADFVSSAEEVSFLKIAALRFIRKYDALFEEILASSGDDIQTIEARAYEINEDRYYLFPAHTVSFHFAERQKLRPQQLHDVVGALITATMRGKNQFICDMRVHKEGCVFTLLDGRGQHQRGFLFFRAENSNPPSVLDKNGVVYKQEKNNKNMYLSKKASNRALMRDYLRETPLYFTRKHLSQY